VPGRRTKAHPRPFPKGRENPFDEMQVVNVCLQILQEPFRRRSLPSLCEEPGLGVTRPENS
jgi:hypothetical protein